MLILVIHLLNRSLQSFGKWVFQERIYQKRVFSSLWQFQIIFVHTNLNLRPLLSITFPQGFQKSKKFGHWSRIEKVRTDIHFDLQKESAQMANSLKKDKFVLTYRKKNVGGSDKIWIFHKGCVSTRRDCHQPGYPVLLL